MSMDLNGAPNNLLRKLILFHLPHLCALCASAISAFPFLHCAQQERARGLNDFFLNGYV